MDRYGGSRPHNASIRALPRGAAARTKQLSEPYTEYRGPAAAGGKPTTGRLLLRNIARYAEQGDTSMTMLSNTTARAKAQIGQALGVLFIATCLIAIVLTIVLPEGTSAASSTTSIPNGMWISQAELAQLPMAGPAWLRLKAAADGSLGIPNIADQNSDHDVKTLAVALVYARTGNAAYRAKAANAIMAAVGTERGGRTLALGRNLPGYVIAADLIDLRDYDAARDQQFRSWLSAVRREPMD